MRPANRLAAALFGTDSERKCSCRGRSGRATVRERRRQLRELANRAEKFIEVTEQISDQTVGQPSSMLRILAQHAPKAEIYIVKRVDQLAHCFDCVGEARSIFRETRAR